MLSNVKISWDHHPDVKLSDWLQSCLVMIDIPSKVNYKHQDPEGTNPENKMWTEYVV